MLEAIIGLGIFAVVVLVIFGIFGSVGRSNAQARQHAMARNLARQALDRELGKPYASVISVAPTMVSGFFTSNGVDSRVDYQVEVVVTELVANERKSVLSRVRWDHGEIQRKVELESFVVSL